jgi:hypothetical protein
MRPGKIGEKIGGRREERRARYRSGNSWLTLVGFMRGTTMNVYAGAERILVTSTGDG